MTGTRDPLQYEDWENQLLSGLDILETGIQSFEADVSVEEIGHVTRIDGGVAEVTGLPRVRSEELVEFASGALGLAYDLSPDRIGVILLDEMTDIEAGEEARRSGRVLSAPVGDTLLGRVIDPTGRPLDGGGRIEREDLWPVERPAPAIMDRAPVDTPLQTGIKAIDALIPIGRGQRELIVGDRQTGKTAIAIDTVLNQRGRDVVCVYCAVGIRSSAVAKIVSDLEEGGAMDYTTVVVAAGDDPPGRQFIAPYAAMTIAEYFAERGDDVLIVFDDLTRHARAYRELSLLLRRPPGREAYPGDIFYIHSRLLERPTNLEDAGTLTALPIIETQAQNISAYIPTNLISITDGQIYLSPKLFQQGVLPAIDVGRSVSRVGGRAQLPAYRSVSGDLRLSYSQFEELERFSRYGARLEEEREQQLRRGRRVREILKQARYDPLDVREQIAVLAAVTGGAFDEIELDQVQGAIPRVVERLLDEFSELFEDISAGAELEDDDLVRMRQTAHEAAMRRQ